MNMGTNTGTVILIIAPVINEYTTISPLVTFSTIGRQTSIDDEPGSDMASRQPSFSATRGIKIMPKSSRIILWKNHYAPRNPL